MGTFTQVSVKKVVRFGFGFVCLFETGFLCVVLVPVLELAQAGLKLTETHLPLPPEYWEVVHFIPQPQQSTGLAVLVK